MRPAALALIAFAAAMIAVGIWTVGGPGQARAERRDQQRMNDLQGLAHHLICLHGEGLGSDDTSPGCPPPERRTDPLTGAPYRVETASSALARVCAEFETRLPRQWHGWADFDRDTGCLVVRMRDARRS